MFWGGAYPTLDAGATYVCVAVEAGFTLDPKPPPSPLSNNVPPGAMVPGSGNLCNAPNPDTHPIAPSPPQPRRGVIVTSLTTSTSELYTHNRSGRSK